MSGYKEYFTHSGYLNGKNDNITRVNKAGNSVVYNNANRFKIVHSCFTNIKNMHTIIGKGFGFQES